MHHSYVTIWLLYTAPNYLHGFRFLFVWFFFLSFVFSPCWLVGFWKFKWSKTGKNNTIIMIIYLSSIVEVDANDLPRTLASHGRTNSSSETKVVQEIKYILIIKFGNNDPFQNIQSRDKTLFSFNPSLSQSEIAAKSQISGKNCWQTGELRFVQC
jgi:hypothetical protein